MSLEAFNFERLAHDIGALEVGVSSRMAGRLCCVCDPQIIGLCPDDTGYGRLRGGLSARRVPRSELREGDPMIDHGENNQLRAFVERIERINAEIDEKNEDKREIFAEVKSSGFDSKIVKKVVADRAKDPSKLREEQEIYDLYWSSVGVS
jgi:uncharacterized protein (UPF0335 family)